MGRHRVWGVIRYEAPSGMERHRIWCAIGFGALSDTGRLWVRGAIGSGAPLDMGLHRVWGDIEYGAPSFLGRQRVWAPSGRGYHRMGYHSDYVYIFRRYILDVWLCSPLWMINTYEIFPHIFLDNTTLIYNVYCFGSSLTRKSINSK